MIESFVLMVVEASVTSISLNHSTIVVLKVEKFNEKLDKNKNKNHKDITEIDIDKLIIKLWKNKKILCYRQEYCFLSINPK